MEPQQNKAESIIAPLKKVTPLSKYLAMILFIVMPFIGGWIGYMYAPEKVVEVERVVMPREESAKPINETVNNVADSNLTSFPDDSRYKTDGNSVYLFSDFEPRDNDDSIKKYTLVGADPETFEPKIVRLFPISQGNTFQAWISRDKNSVFYQDKKIEGADSASFVIDDEVPITKDVDDVFLYFKKIPNADPKTYKVVFNTGAGGPGKVFGKDINNCYLDYEVLNCAEIPTTYEEAVNFVK